jgi:hypothetical protein
MRAQGCGGGNQAEPEGNASVALRPAVHTFDPDPGGECDRALAVYNGPTFDGIGHPGLTRRHPPIVYCGVRGGWADLSVSDLVPRRPLRADVA